MLKTVLTIALFGLIFSQTNASILIKGKVVSEGNQKDDLSGLELKIQVQDASRQDVAAISIKSLQKTLPKGQKFPIDFEIEVDKLESFYSISGQIRKNDELFYLNDEHHDISEPNNVILKVIKVAEFGEFDRKVCSLNAEPGHCLNYHIRYYYDTLTKSCEQFIYSGCGGNDNRFDSLEDCEVNCIREPETPAPETTPQPAKNAAETTSTSTTFKPNYPKSEECMKSLEMGPCRGRLLRFYFNKYTKNCEPFIYGGCLGNENNFQDYEKCAMSCL